jgi:hypothetical protein
MTAPSPKPSRASQRRRGATSRLLEAAARAIERLAAENPSATLADAADRIRGMKPLPAIEATALDAEIADLDEARPMMYLAAREAERS